MLPFILERKPIEKERACSYLTNFNSLDPTQHFSQEHHDLQFNTRDIDKILYLFCKGISKLNSDDFSFIIDACQFVISLSFYTKPSEELILSLQNLLEKSKLELSAFYELQNILFEKRNTKTKVIKHISVYKMLINVFFKHLNFCHTSDNPILR